MWLACVRKVGALMTKLAAGWSTQLLSGAVLAESWPLQMRRLL